jgi:Arc/MetJ-type ribon-helix-helix transcriptional regulator
MPKIATEIPNDLYRKMQEEVDSGLYPDVSKAASTSLKKAYAQKSRTYLRWLFAKEGIRKTVLLNEIGKR